MTRTCTASSSPFPFLNSRRLYRLTLCFPINSHFQRSVLTRTDVGLNQTFLSAAKTSEITASTQYTASLEGKGVDFLLLKTSSYHKSIRNKIHHFRICKDFCVRYRILDNFCNLRHESPESPKHSGDSFLDTNFGYEMKVRTEI